MIAPLYFSAESASSKPYALTTPVYCGHCRRSNRQMATIFCHFCSKTSNKQFLCPNCDVVVHALSTRRKHKRRLIVLGSGLHKKILYTGSTDSTVLPLDRVRIKVSTQIFHSSGSHKEPPRYLNFIVGTSGESVHILINSLQTVFSSSSSEIFLTCNYCEQFLGRTRIKKITKDPHISSVGSSSTTTPLTVLYWENETFIIPHHIQPSQNNENNILRVQLFEKPYSHLAPICRGQVLFSLHSLLKRTATIPEPTSFLFDEIQFIGRLFCSVGLRDRYFYLRIDGFHHYIVPSEDVQYAYCEIFYNGQCVKRFHTKNTNNIFKLSTPEFRMFLRGKDLSDTVFEVNISTIGSALQIGRVLLTVKDILSMLSEVFDSAEVSLTIRENNLELYELLSAKRVIGRDNHGELEVIIQEELGTQYLTGNQEYSESAEGDGADNGETSGRRRLNKRRQQSSSVKSGRSYSGHSASIKRLGEGIGRGMSRLSQRGKSFLGFLAGNTNEDEEEGEDNSESDPNSNSRPERVHHHKHFIARSMNLLCRPCLRATRRLIAACIEQVVWGSVMVMHVDTSRISPLLYQYLPRPEQHNSSRDTLNVCCVASSKGSVVRGLDVGVGAMHLSEKAEIKCRYDFAYGSNAVGAGIPPRSNVIFTVELLQINHTHAPIYPIRFLYHRLADFSFWVDELVEETEIEEEFLRQLADKHWFVAAVHKTNYKLNLKTQTFFGLYSKKSQKLGNANLLDNEEAESSNEGSEGEDSVAQNDENGISDEAGSEDDSESDGEDPLVQDPGAVAGAKYMWSKRKVYAKVKDT